MNDGATPPSAQFVARVDEFVTLQARFSRKFNLLPSHWLTLHSALAAVRYDDGQWICAAFSTSDIARVSLTSRETVRRSMQWLLAKGLVLRMKRRYAISALTLSEIRAALDPSESESAIDEKASAASASRLIVLAGQ